MLSRPFDAQEIWLKEDEKEPCDTWRTVSLVTAMRHILQRSPSDFAEPGLRRHVIRKAANVLLDRGIDADALIRYGMARELMFAVIHSSVSALLDNSRRQARGEFELGWSNALGLDSLEAPPNTDLDSLAKYISRLVQSLVVHTRQWVATAPFDDLLDLTPPEPAVFDGAVDQVPEDLATQYRWLVDRFSVTFLRDWTTTSLHAEFRWMRGEVPPPCAAGLMDEREVLRPTLTEEIAVRAVRDAETKFSHSPLAMQMYRWAKDLLSQRRYNEAAAIFEFAATQNPDDPTVYNNSGFCLIPIDPEKALERFARARQLRYEPACILVHNMMSANQALSRPRTALAIAEEYWSGMAADDEPVAGTLWNDGPPWAAVESADVQADVANLAYQIAVRTEATRAITAWRARTVPSR